MNPLDVLRYTMPVLLAAQGEGVGQITGALNIGLEGQMLVAAYFSMDVTRRTHNPFLGLIAGVAAALISAALSGFLSLKLNRDPVVVGTVLNLGAVGLTGFLFQQTFGNGGALVSVEKLPLIGKVDPLMIVMLVSPIFLTFLINRTRWGLAAKAVGHYPKAAEVAGIGAIRIRATGLAVSGFYAGLAGTSLTLVLTGSFNENMTAGRGFMALALVTFGNWKHWGILWAALLVGVAEALQFYFQSSRIALPHQLFVALPYLLSFAVLLISGRGATAPKDLGRPLRS